MGLIAYVAVAVFYALFDLLAARGLLYTVNLLGLAAFRGLHDRAVLQLPVPLDSGAIFLYNAWHLAVSLVIGVIVLRLVDIAERHPAEGRVVLLIIVGGFVLTILAVGVLTQPIRPVLPWWSIVGANTLAVVVASWYVLRQHPGIWRRLAYAT